MAQADGNVLIIGETGTGKTLVARALHACGPHASRSMVTLNCAAVPKSELEDTLFGSADNPERGMNDQAKAASCALKMWMP